MMSKKRLVLFWLVATSPMFSAESQKITIKNSSVQGKGVVLLEANLAGRSAELECFLSQKSCATLAPGDYLMVRLTNGGVYQDCANVEVYSAGGHPTKDKPLGEYCLLQP